MANKISTDEWVAKAKATHGDKYDYSKTEYKNAGTKVEIICRIHGSFFQTPYNHIKGSGCPLCFGNPIVNKSIFIERSQKVHGDKYDYSQSEYKNMHTKVKIICPEHGSFEQEPNLHMRGAGCPGCSGNRRLNTEEFIRKAKIIHGNSYDYSLVKYINARIPVEIICKRHGMFKQDPYNHLKGRGCAKCSAENNGPKRRLSSEEVIQKLKEVHGDTYDYSLVEYSLSNEKIKIVCKIHGVFEQDFQHHLRGEKCPKCAIRDNRYTQQEFLKKCEKVHGNRYDYSRAKYTVSNNKVEIICPKHGSFFQVAGTHMAGKGCPKCKTSKLSLKIAALLDKLKIPYETEKKYDWLRLTNMLRLDFYLPDYNVAIECQGMQHFGPVKEWGGQDGFTEDCIRDEVKRKLCEKHGVKLFYYARKQDVPDGWDKYEVFTDSRKLISAILEYSKHKSGCNE